MTKLPRGNAFRGQLFGGFAPTYIDLIALRTVSAGARERQHGWLITLSMRVEYIERVEGPRQDLVLLGRSAATRASYLLHARLREVPWAFAEHGVDGGSC